MDEPPDEIMEREKRRAALILSPAIAELSPKQVNQLRSLASAVVHHLEDPPLIELVRPVLLEMMKILRPITAADFRRMTEDGDGEIHH